MKPFKRFLKDAPGELPTNGQFDANSRDYFVSRTISYKSPLGCIGIVAVDRHNISHVFFTEEFPFDDPEHIRSQYPVLTRIQELLDRYFAGVPLDASKVPIHIDRGTSFQKRVWHMLEQIPYGEVRSYKWIAERIKQPKAVRAVGNAVGANTVTILRPCHRVIRSDGTLGGYGGGLKRKRSLLAIEGHAIEKLK